MMSWNSNEIVFSFTCKYALERKLRKLDPTAPPKGTFVSMVGASRHRRTAKVTHDAPAESSLPFLFTN